MLLKDNWVKEEKKDWRYIETKESGNKTDDSFWDAAKAVKREKFVSLQAYLKKQEKSQVNNLISHLKDLKKENQNRPE